MSKIYLSNSGIGKYLFCPKSYQLHYIKKIRPVTFSSNLVFGSAIDNALNYMLENLDKKNVLKETLLEFDKHFEQGTDSRGEIVDMPLNPNIEYAKMDFDPDLLEKADWRELFSYDANFFDTKKEVEESMTTTEDEDGNEILGKKWLEIDEQKRSVLNYATWKCLSKKGKLLLEAYYNDLLPYIKEVIAVQMDVSIEDENGDVLPGVLDAVVRLHGEKFNLDYDPVVILDNKTASAKYDTHSVVNSAQLAKYKAILNIKNEDPEDEWKHHIDLCAFAVMVKKLKKDKKKECKECGHIGTTKHKTCDNIIDGKRCNGEWEKTCKIDCVTQFVLDEIPQEKVIESLEDADMVKTAIEMNIFPKNQSNCKNLFGRPCPYINFCVNGDMHGLLIKEQNKD